MSLIVYMKHVHYQHEALFCSLVYMSSQYRLQHIAATDIEQTDTTSKHAAVITLPHLHRHQQGAMATHQLRRLSRVSRTCSWWRIISTTCDAYGTLCRAGTD